MLEDSSSPRVLASHCDSIAPAGVVPKNDGGEVGTGRGREGEEGTGVEGTGGAGRGEEGGDTSYLTASDDYSSLLDDQLFSDRTPVGHKNEEEEEEKEVGEKEIQEEVGAKGDLTPEELNQRFQSQTLDSSWSSSSDTNTPPSPQRPPPGPRDSAASPQQPRLRPEGGGSATTLQKHLSQPPVGSQAPPGCTRARNALSMLRPLLPGLGQEVIAMEMGGATPREVGGGSEGRGCDSCSPPPTPPLHRLPSWVRIHPAHLLTAAKGQPRPRGSSKLFYLAHRNLKKLYQ